MSSKLAPVTAGILGLGTAALSTVDSTEELRSDLSKLDQNAKEHKVSVDTARQAWEDFAIASDETDSAVEATANLLQAGFTESNLQKAVENLTGAYLRFPDTMKIESLADSLQETLATGEATGQFGELLDRLGIGAESFSKGLSACTTEADKQNYVLETLAKAGLADTYNGWRDTNSELVEGKKANLELQKSMAKLADTVQPIMTDIVDAVSDMVDWFNDLSPEVKETTVKMLAFSAALSPIAKVASSVTKGVSFVAKALSKMIKPAIDATSNTGLLGKAMSTLSAIPGGGLIAAFAGLSVAFGTYLANVDTMTKRTREYIQSIHDMQTANQEAVEAAQDTMQDRLAEVEMTKDMAARVLELTGAQSLDNQQKAELSSLVGILNDQYPDLNLLLDEQGRLTKDSAKNLEDYIKNLEQSIKTEALRGVAVTQYKALWDAENNLKNLRSEQKKVTNDLNSVESELYNLTGMTAEQISTQQFQQGNLNFVNMEARDRVGDLITSYRDLLSTSGNLENEIMEQEKVVKDAGDAYKGTVDDMVSVNSDLASSAESGFGAVGTAATDATTAVEDGQEDFDSALNGEEDSYKSSLTEFEEDAKGAGTDAGTGFGDNLKTSLDHKRGPVQTALDKLLGPVNTTMKNLGLPGISIQGFADGGTLRNGLAVVGEEGPEWLSVQSGRATVIPMTTRQRQAVQGSGGNTVHVGITINNGQFTAADAKRVARMVNRELGMVYR